MICWKFPLSFIFSLQAHIGDRNQRRFWGDSAERHHGNASMQLQIERSGQHLHLGDLELPVESARQSVLQSSVHSESFQVASALGTISHSFRMFSCDCFYLSCHIKASAAPHCDGFSIQTYLSARRLFSLDLNTALVPFICVLFSGSLQLKLPSLKLRLYFCRLCILCLYHTRVSSFNLSFCFGIFVFLVLVALSTTQTSLFRQELMCLYCESMEFYTGGIIS